MMTTFKSLVLFAFLFCAFISESKAQSAFEAGVRLGDGFDSFSIDATFPLSKAPRLHSAFYLNNGFDLGLYFDWMFSLDGGPSGLKFYPGVGPELYFGDDFNLGIAGDFGVEYSFKFPLTIGFDYRPGFMVTNKFNFYSGNWGILARFRFVKAG